MFQNCCLDDMIVVCETLFRAGYGRAETLLDEKIFEFRSENFSESFHKLLFAGLGNQKVQRVAEKSEQSGKIIMLGFLCHRSENGSKQKHFQNKNNLIFVINIL